MSARALWIVALAAVLAVVVALNAFRSEEPIRADAGLAIPPPSASAEEGERSPAEPRPLAAPRGAEEPAQLSQPPSDAGDALPQVLADLDLSRFTGMRETILETERALAAESVDPTWEARILGKIAEIPGLRLASLDVECRQALCRLYLVWPGIAPTGPPSAPPPPRDPNAPNVPGPVEVVAATGLKSRFLIAVRDRSGAPVSLAYLERGESAAPSAAAR